MNFRTTILWMVILFLFPQASRAESIAKQKPNVIFILTDDQGWGDASFAGHPTPRHQILTNLRAKAHGFGSSMFLQRCVHPVVPLS